MKLITIIIGLMLTFQATASVNKEARREQARKIARESALSHQLKASTIYQKLVQGKFWTTPTQPCTPTGSSCVDAACAHMPSYNCDDMSEIRDIARACTGNYDGTCVDAACSHMPSYNCDDRSEVTAIAQACSGLTNGNCVNDVCNRMPSYNCDDKYEIIDVINICKGI